MKANRSIDAYFCPLPLPPSAAFTSTRAYAETTIYSIHTNNPNKEGYGQRNGPMQSIS